MRFAKKKAQITHFWSPEWPIQSKPPHRRSPLPTRQSMQRPNQQYPKRVFNLNLRIGRCFNNQNGNLRCFIFSLGVEPSPPLMDIISRHFSPHFFLLQLNHIYWISYMKRILHFVSVKNITFKSFYNWFKIDIFRQLRLLTANYFAMFIVTSTTIYT